MAALVIVRQPNVFTCNPDMTASLLFTVIKKIGGSIELTLDDMNADSVKDGEENDDTLTLVREGLEFNEAGEAVKIRLAVVPRSEAKRLSEEEIARDVARAIREGGSGGETGAQAFIDQMNAQIK